MGQRERRERGRNRKGDRCSCQDSLVLWPEYHAANNRLGADHNESQLPIAGLPVSASDSRLRLLNISQTTNERYDIN